MSACGAHEIHKRGVAGIQMGQAGYLIGAQGAAAAGMLGPAEHPGLEASSFLPLSSEASWTEAVMIRSIG
jgi:hypothetical protein